jgi:hypothetical protein
MPAPVYVAEIFPQFRLAAGTAVVNRYHSDKKSGRGIVSRLQGAFERGRVTAAPAVVFPEKIFLLLTTGRVFRFGSGCSALKWKT